MNPKFASILCTIVIIFLFWTEFRNKNNNPISLWIPFIWMFLSGSRYVSGWINLNPSYVSISGYDKGSPIDAAVFFILIILGFIILFRRKIVWLQWISENKIVFSYFLFCGLSIIWSEISFVSFKRLFKDCGNLIMVLVILSANNPYEVATIIIRRLAYIWLPISVLFIKYFPHLGRAYDYGGNAMYSGIGNQKNSLGMICLITGTYLFWDFIYCQKMKIDLKQISQIKNYILLFILSWLLYMSDSKTSTVCLLFSIFILSFGSTQFMLLKPGRIIFWIIGFSFLVLSIDKLYNLREIAFEILGRDASLTNRVYIWQDLYKMVENPIVGTGYMSFWTGERMEKMWEITNSRIIQAHNGYIEQYLNLGYIGVGFIILIILSGLKKIKEILKIDYKVGMLRLCFLVTAILINISEASFYGVNNMWLLLLLSVVQIPKKEITKTNENV